MKPRFFSLAICLLMAAPLLAQDDQDKDVDVQELMQEAAIHLQSQEFAEAATVFGKVVKADPDNGRAWHLYGYSLHGAGKLDEAIPAHKKATEFDEFKGISLYNLGCAYSLKENNDVALEYLNLAVSEGYKTLVNYESDPDLKNVRKDVRFAKLLARVKGTDKPDKMDAKEKGPNLVGTWNMLSGKKLGADSTSLPQTIKVSNDAFTIPTPDPDQSFVMEYKLDRSKSPMHIDFDIKSGPIPQGKAIGIIKIESGKMTLCYDPSGQNRPEKFASTEENGANLFVMQRQVRKLNAGALVGDWNIVSGVRGADEVAAERLEPVGIKITEETITINAGPDQSFVMKYEIDNEKTPVQIDMEMTSGPAPEGSKAIGIVRMREGKLVLCYDMTAQARPKRFKATEEDGFFMFTLERKKKE